VITRAELARGFNTRERWQYFCDGFHIMGIDDEVIWSAAELFRHLQSAGTLIADNDLWIAATALQAGLPLVTDNVRHFQRVPGLQVRTHRI
jgi:tRNA(fMet)-specific endonuclease VapC